MSFVIVLCLSNKLLLIFNSTSIVLYLFESFFIGISYDCIVAFEVFDHVLFLSFFSGVKKAFICVLPFV